MKRPAVFLDRDNTIIKNDGDLGDPGAVELITGVPLAIASLCGLGYRVVVVTNQGGVARGAYTEEDVEAVHDRISELVQDRANGARIDAFYACPFHPEGTVKAYAKDHENRKPRPGMLLQAAEDLDLDLSASWMVGDQLRDVEAGAAAGCRTILLGNGSLGDGKAAAGDAEPVSKTGGKGGKKKAAPRKRGKKVAPDEVAPTLVEAVRIIASKRKPEANEVMGRARVNSGPSGKRFDKQAMAELQKQGRKPAEADAPEKPTAKSSARPFVPWSEARAEPEPQNDLTSVGVDAQPAPDAAAVAVPASPEPATPPARSAAAEVPVSTPVVEPSTPATSYGLVETPPSSTPVAPSPASGGPPAEPGEVSRNVRLILKELRMQRGSSDELPQLNVVAISLQGLVLLCLLGALWLGAGNDNFYTFFRWITVTLVLQVAVVATLLFGRR